MRQTILTSMLFISSAAGTIAIFHLASIAPLANGMPAYFKQHLAKQHLLYD